MSTVKYEMDEIEVRQLYHTAWEHWGGQTQIDILIEEMSELIHALLRARRQGRNFNGSVFEEMADVSICLDQMIKHLEEQSKDDDFIEQVNYKRSRLYVRLMESMTNKMEGS